MGFSIPDAPMHANRVQTSRLLLEPLTLDHSAGMFALWRDPEVCLYSGPASDVDGCVIPLPARTAADSDRIIALFLARQSALRADDFGFRWAMLSRSRGDFLGALGFNVLAPCAELAYHQLPSAGGPGFMTEACRAAIDWVAKLAPCVEAFVEAANIPSVRLLERLGFTPDEDIAGGSKGEARRFHRTLRPA